MRKIATCALLVSAAALFGCAEREPISQAKLLDALTKGGVQLSEVQTPPRDPSSPLPNSYSERFTFALPSVAPKGGQAFICTEKAHCDAIYAYFDALKALAGPYIYRSKDGLVVFQLNSGLQPNEASSVKAVIESL
jgi:hypothetical protein